MPEGDPWEREADSRIPDAGEGGARRLHHLESANMDRWQGLFSGGGRFSFWVDSQATAIRYIVRNFPDVEFGGDDLTLAESFLLIWQDEKGKLKDYSFFGADEPYHNALFGAALLGLKARGLLDFQERNGIYLGKYFLPILSGEAPQDSDVLKAVYEELESEPKNSLKMWFEQKSGKWGQDETTRLTIQSLVNRGILEEEVQEGDMFSQAHVVPKDLSRRADIVARIQKLVTGEVKPEEDKRSMALLALCRTADLRDASKSTLMKRIFGKENLEDWIAKVDDKLHDFLPPPGISTEEIEKMLERMPKETQAHIKSDAFKEECKAKFNKVDESGNGALDPHELAPAVQECLPAEYIDAMKIEPNALSDILLMFDSNQNGKIEIEEFSDFMKWAMGMKIIEYFNQKKC